MRRNIANKKGFTLIEISMVLFLFATVITGLLSFFPVGLRQGVQATADTIQSMFALEVFGKIEANASTLGWADWENEASLRKALVKGVTPGDSGAALRWDNNETIKRYLVQRGTIRYHLTGFFPKNGEMANKRLYRVVIWVTDSPGGNPKSFSPFSIDLFYRGNLESDLVTDWMGE